MNEQKNIEILKSAILLEKRGRAFYELIAQQSTNASVKQFFSLMAAEEAHHVQMLEEQFKNVHGAERFCESSFQPSAHMPAEILTKKIIESISAASYEAAAISAAMALEQQAVSLYSQRAQKSTDEIEKKLYQWLADWEKTHLDLLVHIDDDLKQKIWFDNHFWPM